MVELHDHSCRLSTAAEMGGRLAESASEKRIVENGREPEALPLNSSQAMSDQRRHNSADTSGDDGKPQRTGLDLSREDQLTTFAVTPRVEAAADEPYHVFGKHVKYLTVILISVAGNFSGLSSSTYFPALKTITKVTIWLNPVSTPWLHTMLPADVPGEQQKLFLRI